MKHHYMNLIVLFCMCVVGLSTANAGGRTVHVLLRDGSSVTGELIIVRVNGLSLYTGQEDVSDETLLRDPKYLTSIPLSNIESVHSKGESHVGSGMLIGTGVGLVMGLTIAAVAASNEPEPKDPLDGIATAVAEPMAMAAVTAMGMLGGFTAGTLVGIASSSSDLDLYTLDTRELTQLALCSRFPNQGRPGYGVSTAGSRYGFTFDNQARILSVLPGSPAFAGDLHFKDSIVSVNARAIPVGSLSGILKLVNVGDSLRVTVQRDGETIQKTLAK